MKSLCRLVASLALLAVPAAAQYHYPFQDPKLPEEERVNSLLKLMTVEEKIACLGTHPDVPRLGVDGAGHVEGLHGLALGGPGGWGKIRGGGNVPVTTTQFPQAIGLGETWDPELLRQAAAVEGYETRYAFQQLHRGGLVVRAPNADLVRDPRWGRAEESYGEDAYFNGTMAVAFIHGLQGDDPHYWLTAALMKHFLANSNEDGRAHTSSDYDERLWREYYSVPFRMGVIEGGSRAYMASYNATNGVPDHIQPFLKSITVKEWGQDGIICTDGGGLRLLVTEHKRFPELDQAAAAVIKAGIGQFLDNYADATRSALQKGLLTEADIDESLRGVFRVMLRLGQFDPPSMVPYRSIGGRDEPWQSEKTKTLVRLVTQKSIVLLKNAPMKDSHALLPLDRNAIKTAAVIGPYADQVLLDWYSGTPPYAVSALDGIKSRLGPGVALRYARDNTNNAAVEAARGADVAIVVVGNHPVCNAGWDLCPLPSDGKEDIDRKSLTLEQEEIVKAVYAVNPRTVVVLIASFPYVINWTAQNVPAIVHMTHNSQEAGNALADVIFGDFNPGGRLTETWPASMDQLPPMMDYNIRHGRTYMYFKGTPLYPFGYGLSYTNFRYSNPRVSKSRLAAASALTVNVDVENTGNREGDEVVQLYVRYPKSKVERPQLELKGFRRVTLKAGEKKTVEIPLKASSLAYWDVEVKRWVVEPGRAELMIGRNAATIEFRKEVAVE